LKYSRNTGSEEECGESDASPSRPRLPLAGRRVPYGDVDEYGLYFVAFSADCAGYDRMLARMFGPGGDGVHDRLTDFSRPVGGV
jgi:porphyrinogen peroxidase